MTKIGSIRLNLVRKSSTLVTFESEKGGYSLQVPRHPDFILLPDYIEITVSTESKWISNLSPEREELPEPLPLD